MFFYTSGGVGVCCFFMKTNVFLYIRGVLWIICYWLSLPPISPTHRGHCLGKACVYREPRRQRLLHGPVVWARAPRYSLLLFHKGVAAGPRAEPLLLLDKGIATRPRAEPMGNRIDNLINKKMCFQMFQGGVGFPRISNRCSIEILRIFYGLSTQPHAFTVLTTKETGRHRLLWRTNTVANN